MTASTITPTSTCRRWRPVTLKNVAPTRGVPPNGFRNGRHPSPSMDTHSRRWSAANSVPSNIVAPSQRSAAAFRPACAASTAAMTVRLLVSNTTVITMPLAIEGQNAKGCVQSGFATRTYPYANSSAANVAASATMNIQMPSLRDGTANGEGSCTAVSSATDRQQGKEIEPQHSHEMPVERRRLQRRPRQAAGCEPPLHKPQPAESAEDVQRMQHGEYVEECAAGTRRQMEVLRGELSPRQPLTDKEQDSENQRGVQAEGSKAAPRQLERHAAEQQHQRIHIQQRRQVQVLPISAAALPHHERAREGGKGHRNGPDGDPYTGLGDAPLRPAGCRDGAARQCRR